MNNWYVITGAPCSGKTTVIKQLEKKGYKVIHEIPRVIIDEKMQKGLTLEEIKTHSIEFQIEILQRRLAIENDLPKDEITFFDRGIPDSVPYYQYFKLQDSGLLSEAMNKSEYKRVFLFETVDYQTDYARKESYEQILKLQRLIKKTYKSIKIPLMFIPKLSVEERVTLLLENL
jgi:predicted ATPase